MSRNLVVHFKRVTYLVTPSPTTTPLGGTTVQIRQWSDGRVDIYCGVQNLPYAIFDKKPINVSEQFQSTRRPAGQEGQSGQNFFYRRFSLGG